MWLRLLLGYVSDETPSVELKRKRKRLSKRESQVMRWWLLLGYVPDELLSVLPM